ncbi:MAG: type I-C CRISPR-associated protein Cas7/Csd2 [Candidatus Gastranaerophilales bacterium]|nr:type I-C CRISPR-associated protein Cas7/Csd2 [Candidatus Gastranaerophilales bacterium]
MSELIKNRHEFVVLFDVENGNPNGDPDAGNMPRIDVEAGYGIVTDVCLKRKIRNFVETKKNDEQGYKIYIKQGVALNAKHREAFESQGLKASKDKPDLNAKTFMCQNYFDIRTFGAVMTTGDYNCGQVRGPVQINFGRSIDPVISNEITITRQAITTEKDAETKSTEFGKKFIVPYGLYKAEGYISSKLAQQTGFSTDDLELLWEAIINMFEHDHSAARGKMAVRKLIVFKHDSELGNAPSHKLFELIKAEAKDNTQPIRSFSDYEVSIDRNSVPQGVELIEKL